MSLHIHVRKTDDGHWTTTTHGLETPNSWHDTPADATARALGSVGSSGGGTVQRREVDGSLTKWIVRPDKTVVKL